ncbi:MAG TPA: T9SS type A sorting domain-containing protein [Sediminibacterium sp.]|nr:T9SS type A sorting domain-containing protein [Sediminibacterium sp.]
MRLRKYCFLLFLAGKTIETPAQEATGTGYLQKNTIYRQNFDELPASGTYVLSGKGPHLLTSPPVGAGETDGWMFRQTGGTGSNAVFLVGSGTGTGQGVYSAGSPGSTDRALGTLASGSGNYSIGLVLINNTGAVLNSISVAFITEQWRKGGSGKPNRWTCKYKTGRMEQIDQDGLQELALLNFSSVVSSTGAGSLNGNLPANQAKISQTVRISNWNPGERLLLCWEDADESGSDDLVAIDQFEFSADYAEPEPVSVHEFLRLSAPATNADTIRYSIRFDGNISGLTTGNFSLQTTGLRNAAITRVEGSGTDYMATIFTGEGTGWLLPGIANDSNLVPGLQQVPFYAIDSQWIDKTGPEIVQVYIPDRPMKCGDSVPLIIRIATETGHCSLWQGSLHQLPFNGFTKINDSTCTAYIRLPDTGTDLTATENIATDIQLQDSLGNKGKPYHADIAQGNDPIDINLPQQVSFYANTDSLLYSGDTLQLVLRFSERVMPAADTAAVFIPVTIGNRIRNIVYAGGSNSDSLLFRYVIQPNESDKDGIRISSAFSEQTLPITDLAGNPAQCNIQSAAIRHIRVDAIAPEFYAAADTLIELCAGTQRYRLDSLLKARNKSPEEVLTWQLYHAPNQVNISKPTDQQYGSSSTLLPQNIFYENQPGYTGVDSCVFLLTDGGNTVYKKIRFQINPLINENRIEGEQEICSSSLPQLLIGFDSGTSDSSSVFLWESSTVSDSIGFVAAPGLNREKNYQPAAITKTTWFRRKGINGACTGFSNILKIQVRTKAFWTGDADNDWQNKNNWCETALPANTDSVYISAACRYQPGIRTTAGCSVLVLPRNTTLTITGTLQIGQQILSDTAAINASNGSIILNGTHVQAFNGGCLKEKTLGQLIISNPSGVVLTDTLRINRSLQLLQGQLQTNNRLHLKYGSSVGTISGGASINGTVWAGHPFGRYYTQPLLAGHPFNSSMIDTMPNNTMKIYYNDPMINTDSFSIWQNWKAESQDPGSQVNRWKPYQGVLLKPAGTGDTTRPNDPVVPALFNGALNTGLQKIPLKRNEYAGFNVIANPFPAPVDLSAFIRGNNTAPYYWIWNKAQGMQGGFLPLPSTQSFVVNPFEAFIAACIGSSEDLLQVPEESKTDLWNGGTRPLFREERGYFIELGIYSGQQFWDRLVLLENPGTKNGLDSLDALKLYNPDLNCYSRSSDGKKLAVDARKLDSAARIPVFVETDLNQPFYFKAEQAFLPANNQLVLYDRYTNQWMPLQKDSILHFSFYADSASRMAGRFEISRLVPRGDLGRLIRNLTVKLFPNPVGDWLTVGFEANTAGPATLQIYTLPGALVKSVSLGNLQKGTVQVSLKAIAPGSYLLQLICGSQQKTIPFLKQ